MPDSIDPSLQPEDRPEDRSDWQPETETEMPDPSQMSIEEWLERLQSNDRAFYNMMAMEVWSIAKSMDTLQPGFWNRFMENRHNAMRKLISKRRQGSQPPQSTDSNNNSEEIIMFPPRSPEDGHQ